jgi:hypothetical protein
MEDLQPDGPRVVIAHPHPELLEGEVWESNDPIDPWDQCQAYGLDDDEIEKMENERNSWKTRREGIDAYDRDGKLIEEMMPIFVQREELEARGVVVRGPEGEEKEWFIPRKDTERYPRNRSFLPARTE